MAAPLDQTNFSAGGPAWLVLPPWNNACYSPANTFMNGDPYGGPYTHNTDSKSPSRTPERVVTRAPELQLG
jgi:hypothetical protein